MKVVIDSNLLISSLLGKLTSGIINDIILQKYELITSNQQIDEVIGVLKRAKFRDKIPMTKIQELENALKNIGTIVELYGNIFDCRDPKDNFILEMGVSGNSDYIVTGDEDLLILNPYKKIPILKYSEFIEL